MIIGFNHNYYLRHDGKRTILASNPSAVEQGFIGIWLSRIHPIHAMLFSLLSYPQDIIDAEKKIAKFFGIAVEKAKDILSPFLKSNEMYTWKYENTISYFPSDIIKIFSHQEFADYCNRNSDKDFLVYKPSDYKYTTVDNTSRRMIRCPHGLVFIITTNCKTNCIYCYADKTTKCNSILSLISIKRILSEAKQLGIKEIQMIGGEFFMHPEWEEILSVSTEMGFTLHLISTKIPLTLEQLETFKKFNIKLQISLDSINHEVLSKTLKVSEYYAKNIINTIINIDRLKINYKISTVLTQETATIENLSSLYCFLRQLKGLSHWSVRLAFKSLYSNNTFRDIRVTENQFYELKSWYNEIMYDSNTFTLEFPEDFEANYRYAKNGSRSYLGSHCSANMSHMVILPDGKVTICEQLYWNPRFIIGDIHKSSIENIWNSQKAKFLSNLQQREISDRSVCSSCKIYESCRDFANKCYANTIKAYGDENWDFPDPRCELAPSFLYDIS